MKSDSWLQHCAFFHVQGHQQYPSHTFEKAIRVAVRRDLKEMAVRKLLRRLLSNATWHSEIPAFAQIDVTGFPGLGWAGV